MRHLHGQHPDERWAVVARDLAIPVPFDIGVFTARLGARTGRVVELVPAGMGPGDPSGTLLRTADADYLCYERRTSPFHQAHIALSLTAYLLAGDATGPLIDRRLVPDLSPQLVRLMLGEPAGSAVAEAEAEAFAFIVLERAGAAACPAASAWRALRRLAPLRSALAGVLPEVADPVPAGRRGVRFRLYQRVIEIRDAVLALQPYRDPEVASAAKRIARAAGFDGDELAVMVEAAVLAGAVRAWETGRRVPQSATEPGQVPALGLDLRSETHWLVTVSRAFDRLCHDGETGRRRRSWEPSGRHGALDGKRSRPTAPLNAWSLY